jgi:hypothetical protein
VSSGSILCPAVAGQSLYRVLGCEGAPPDSRHYPQHLANQVRQNLRGLPLFTEFSTVHGLSQEVPEGGAGEILSGASAMVVGLCPLFSAGGG